MNAIHSYCFFCDRCQKKVVFLLVLKTGIVLNAVAFSFFLLPSDLKLKLLLEKLWRVAVIVLFQVLPLW